MRWFVPLMVTLLLCTSCTTLHVQLQPAPAASAQWYILGMFDRIALSRQQLPVMEMAGQAAARRAVAGGVIWAGGSQADFAPEAVGRAGGLIGTKTLDLSQVFRNDVVLYGARGTLSSEDLSTIAQCKSAGAYVVAFAEAEGSQRTPQGPDLLIDSGDFSGLSTSHGICPLDTVTNIMNLWVFTGEFTAACTRLGKMPTVYRSYGLPGARERDTRYAGQMFHTDMTIAPIEAGVLGTAYLDTIGRILTKVAHDDQDDITQAGRWVGAAPAAACGAQFVAHMFPGNYRDPRAPQPFSAMVGQTDPTPKKIVLIHISYQRPPQDLIDTARRQHTRFFCCSVLRGSGGISEYSLYANPHWPIEDACVAVPGYDTPILPASGVIQATIYWSIVAEAYRGQ